MLSGELFATVLYVVQQLGVMLGVGAQTVLLCAFLVFVHRKESDDAHTGFVRAVRVAQMVGLVLMVGSGAGAVAFHYLTHTTEVLLAPAFVFKWLLIAVVVLCYMAEKRLTHGFGRGVLEGFAGATWYALFLVHSLAPVATLPALGVVYAAWLAFFAIIWAVFAAIMHFGTVVPKRALKMPVMPKMPPLPAMPKMPDMPHIKVAPPPPAPAPVVAAVAPPPKPPAPVHVPLPVVVLAELPPAHVAAPKPVAPPPPPKPVAPPPPPPPAAEEKRSLFADHSPWLRALHIMPQTKEDADKHHASLQIA